MRDRLEPDDDLPIPDIEDTAALPANLVYSKGAIESLSDVGPHERCSSPLHIWHMAGLGRCRDCGDARYPDAAVPAGLVSDPAQWAPGHALLMRDDAGGDVRYPDAAERERARAAERELKALERSLQTSAKLAAMSIDDLIAPPEMASERRLAYELTSEGTKAEIVEKLGELFTEYYRYGPGGYKGGAEAVVNAAVAIVLDTVSA